MNAPRDSRTTRREWFFKAGSIVPGAALIAAVNPIPQAGEEKKKEEKTEEGISPVEDLMREHGVLNRILLVYEEIINRLHKRQEFPPDVPVAAAGIIRHFVEDYHEKLEEDHLFPRFEKAGKLVELVKVLRQQHAVGRRLTDSILERSTSALLKEETVRQQFIRHVQLFVHMYRPHESREDTVLFPAFRSIVSANEYASLGEMFEDKENELFGAEGFEKIVADVGELEKQLGLEDLAKFTPKI